MFEKSLQDLVKGIRSCKGDVSVYISQCMQEIKQELKSTDQHIKAQAIRKLTYLNMQGYDMSWAAFHVVEVMSYERFAYKRIGYLAACQSFTQSTDVVLLCTNLFKKEFGSLNEYEIGLAINTMANIVTSDLARDLLGDIISLMNSPKSYVRKKATLVLYKLFLRYPQGLRLTFDRLKERMEEPDVSVVSCSVNVICELANKKPKNYVGLAPQFFRLLTTSSNNWMLIKVVKLMASLVPEEPRLARKLLDPLATIIQNTPAKSLLYECISTITTALLYTKKSDGSQPRNVPAIVKLCNDHLRRYIEDPDQNLRYLGLVGLSNLMNSHPHVILEHQQLILECLSVEDITIRLRSLELVVGMINPENAPPIITELMRHTHNSDGLYRQELVNKIIQVCSANKYHHINDFEWYITILTQLAYLPHAAGLSGSNSSYNVVSHGTEISKQLIDIAVRVKSIRYVIVSKMIKLLCDKNALNGAGAQTVCEVLFAASWVTGEYIMYYLDKKDSDDDDEEEEDEEDEDELIEERLETVCEIIDEMLQPRSTSLPAHVQACYMQTLLKLLCSIQEKADDETVEKMASMIIDRIPAFVQSEHIEVQERACCLQEVILGLRMGLSTLRPEERASRAFDSTSSITDEEKINLLSSFFAETLAPVGSKAQKKVPLPNGLDLDEPINAQEAQFLELGGDVTMSSDNDDLEVSFVQNSSQDTGYMNIKDDGDDENSDSETNESDKATQAEKKYELERERLRQDPFYLSNKDKESALYNPDNTFGNLMDALEASGKKKKSTKKKDKKPKKQRAILMDEMMPDGAQSSGEDNFNSKRRTQYEVSDLSQVDLTVPLGDDERIPDQHWYHRQSDDIAPVEKKKKSKKSDSTKSSRDKKESKKKSKKNAVVEGNDESVIKKKKSKDSELISNEDEDSGIGSKSSKSKKSSSKKKSSKTDDNDGEVKKTKKSKSSKSSKSKPAADGGGALAHEEPLLMF